MNALNVAKKVKREAFFKAGGTVKAWSGGNKRFVDRKKQANKMNCRTKSEE